MKYAELNDQGFVIGINNVGGDGWVSCDGLTDWQIAHQGQLQYVNGAWDTSHVDAEPVASIPDAKQEALDNIQATLLTINVPPDAVQALKDSLAILTS